MQYNNPFQSTSFNHTFDFGKNLSNSIEYGSVILLKGDLGSGKTTFCKGFASGLGFKDEILSPTYSILNEYQVNGKNLYHFDLYRLKSINEFIEIGGLEYLNN
jgi:tRNA threonylcarbamoyladenosine biosynthesis protein TsaE